MENPIGSGSVSTKKVLWVGLVIALFNAPIAGIVYSLLFVFKKETYREALIVLAWSIVWATLFTLFLVWVRSQGLLHIAVH